MPPYVLTEQEKAEFRRKYIENVRRANEYLSEGNKIKLDLNAFDKKINDPKMQRLYKKGLEIHRTRIEKERISNEIFHRLGGANDKTKRYDINRILYSEIIPSEDPEAMAYNEQKIRAYIEHPEAETVRRYQELLNLDISDVAKFADSPDAKNFFLDYYEKNSAALDLANETKHILSRRLDKTPALEEHVKHIGANFELLASIQDISAAVKGEEFFTFPDGLNEDQFTELFSSSSYLQDHPEIGNAQKNKVTNELYTKTLDKDFKNFFAVCKEKNIDFSNGASLAGIYATDTTTGQKIPFTRYANIEAWKKEHPEHETNLVRRDSVLDVELNADTLQPTILPAEQVNEIKQITTVDRSHEEGYVNAQMPDRFKKNIVDIAKDDVLYNFALDNKLNLGDVAAKGIYGLADSFKGNWKERMFNTTSHQYKIFKENLKNFENPKNASYNHPKPVVDSANVYLAHKGVTTEEEARRLPPPGDQRALLCLSVVKTFKEQYGLVRDEAANQNAAENNNIVRQPAIVDPRLLDDDFANDISVDSDNNNLSMDNAFENDINHDPR